MFLKGVVLCMGSDCGAFCMVDVKGGQDGGLV